MISFHVESTGFKFEEDKLVDKSGHSFKNFFLSLSNLCHSQNGIVQPSMVFFLINKLHLVLTQSWHNATRGITRSSDIVDKRNYFRSLETLKKGK